MPIQLKDQFILQVDLGGRKDFLTVTDLVALEYHRKAGQCLPTLTLCFILRDPTLIPYISSGNDITISLGRDILSSEVYTFSIFSEGSINEPKLGDRVTIYGVANKGSFTQSQGNQIYSKKTSLEVLKEVTKDYFSFVTNIKKTNDRQNWCKFGSYWNFCREVASAAFVNENTFIMSAFDCNRFYFYDARQHLKTSRPWVFSKSNLSLDERSKSVNYISAIPTNNNGVYNYLAGYNDTAVVYDVLEDEYKKIRPKIHNLTSIGKKVLNIPKGSSTSSYYLDIGNTHDNYTLARLLNIKSNAIYSSVAVSVVTKGFSKDIRLLDTAILTEESTTGRNDGYYFVSEISTKIIDCTVNMDIILNRESPNYIKGDLTEG